jgi:hypothetical protein
MPKSMQEMDDADRDELQYRLRAAVAGTLPPGTRFIAVAWDGRDAICVRNLGREDAILLLRGAIHQLEADARAAGDDEAP